MADLITVIGIVIFGVGRALTFIDELREAFLTLAKLPEGLALVPRYEGAGIRRRVYGNYLIFYRIAAQEIQVLHVLHGAHDYEGILFPNG